MSHYEKIAVSGTSMAPLIPLKATVWVNTDKEPELGEVAFLKDLESGEFVVHRRISTRYFKGDNSLNYEDLSHTGVLGTVIACEKNPQDFLLLDKIPRWLNRLLSKLSWYYRWSSPRPVRWALKIVIWPVSAATKLCYSSKTEPSDL